MTGTETATAPTADASLLRIPRGSETVLLGFSPYGTTQDRFHFYPLGEIYPNTSILLVRDPLNRWYNDGLPGVGDTVVEIAEGIEAELATLGAKRVIAIGSSMGSYAAMLFGCIVGAERVIGLSPQTLLSPDLPLWAPPEDLQLQVPDVKPLIDATPRTRIDLVVGWDELIDVFQAQRVASSPSVRVIGIKGAGHGFPVSLHRKNAYWPLVRALVDDAGAPDHLEVKPQLPADLIEGLQKAFLSWGRGDRRGAVHAVARLAERYPAWNAPQRTLALALSLRPELAESLS